MTNGCGGGAEEPRRGNRELRGEEGRVRHQEVVSLLLLRQRENQAGRISVGAGAGSYKVIQRHQPGQALGTALQEHPWSAGETRL